MTIKTHVMTFSFALAFSTACQGNGAQVAEGPATQEAKVSTQTKENLEEASAKKAESEIVAEDYAERADEEIDPSNYQSELDKIAAEISAE